MSNEHAESNLPVRRGFSETEVLARSGDIGVPMAVAMARAEVEARYIVAMRQPRSWAAVEQDLMRECEDIDFAKDKSAIYAKPVGGEVITGLGARFAEAAMRCAKNMLAQAPIVFEDDKQIHRRVSVTDLEANSTRMYDVRIVKTVERKTVDEKDKHTIISARTNSEGATTFTVPATDDALYNKDNSAVSKAWRNGVLALMPKHILKRCEQKILETRTKDASDNPDAARRAIIDGFYSLGVSVVMLEQYLEHPVETCTPSEIVNLQGIYGGLSSGEIDNWRIVMDNVEDMRKRRGKKEAPATGVKAGAKAAEPEGKGVAAAEARVDAKKDAASTTTTAVPAGEGEKKKDTTTKAPAGKAPAATKTDAAALKTDAAKTTAAAPKAETKVETKKTETPKAATSPATTKTAAAKVTPEVDAEAVAGEDAPPWASEDEAPAQVDGEVVTEEEAPVVEEAPDNVKAFEIRGVKFPLVMKRKEDETPVTDGQLSTAKEILAEINPSASIAKTVAEWTEKGCGKALTLEQVNQGTIVAVIEVLNKYKEAKAKK